MFTTPFFHKLALFGYFGLLIWVPLWHFVLTNEGNTSALFKILFWIVPLLLPLKGIVTNKPYTYAWANFVVMIYLMHGLTSIYAIQNEWLYGVIEFIFATCMFIGCSFYARMRGKELGLGLPKLKEVMAEEKQRFER